MHRNLDAGRPFVCMTHCFLSGGGGSGCPSWVIRASWQSSASCAIPYGSCLGSSITGPDVITLTPGAVSGSRVANLRESLNPCLDVLRWPQRLLVVMSRRLRYRDVMLDCCMNGRPSSMLVWMCIADLEARVPVHSVHPYRQGLACSPQNGGLVTRQPAIRCRAFGIM